MRFVDLVLGHEQWSTVNWLHVDDLNIFLEAVTAAGFEARAVRKGSVLGYFRNVNGFKIDESFTLNTTCRFKVVAQNGADHHSATLWLNQTVRNVWAWREENNFSREDIIDMVVGVIEDSVPLRPIRLSNEDDYLREFTRNSGEHLRDIHGIDPLCVGIHMHCGGLLIRLRQSELHDQIVCKGCYGNIVRFPAEIHSYGELRKYTKEILVPPPNFFARTWKRLQALYHRFW
jgi:hypothetical protein